MSVGKVKTDLAGLFNNTNIVNKHSVEEDEAYEETTIVARLQINAIQDNADTSELLKMVRAARAMVPKSYHLKFSFSFWI